MNNINDIIEMIPPGNLKLLYQGVRESRIISRQDYARLVGEVQKINGISMHDIAKADEALVMLKPKTAHHKKLHDAISAYVDDNDSVQNFIKDFKEVQELMYAEFGKSH